MENALAPVLEPNDIIITMLPQHAQTRAFFRQTIGLDIHSRAQGIRKRIGKEIWDDLFTFTFVRQPIERLHSLYRFCHDRIASAPMSSEEREVFLQNDEMPERKPYHLPAVRAVLRTSDFAEFAVHPDLVSSGEAWPQVKFIRDSHDRDLVDFVGKFEDLERDWRVITDRLGVDLSLPMTNRTAFGADRNLPQDIVRTLSDRYAEDYEAFGYPVGT